MVECAQGVDGDLARLVKEYRELAGLTQRELAERAGVSAGAVRDLEQRRSSGARPRTVRALVDALGLPVEDAARVMRAARPASTSPPSVPTSSGGGPLRVEILGPLLVRRGSTAIRVGDGRHRVLLGRLALTPNAPVSRDALVELLWDYDPPASATNLVQTYVSRLRRVLEPQDPPGARARTLTLASGGYQLNVSAEQLDLLSYRELVARAGTDAQPESKFSLLDEALRLWRGSVVADVPGLRDDPVVTSLIEDRIATTIRLGELAEPLGWSAAALPRLRELARQHPLHEPLQSRLMRSLAASGEQAAALNVYRSTCRRLADDLGIDPGPGLKDAHLAVLRQESRGRRRQIAIAPPFETPAPPGDFVGRRDTLQQIEELMARDPSESAPRPLTVCVVSGVAGVGKTSLALYAAEALRSSFPDGQLYVDLLGADRYQAVAPVDALSRFLRALGVDDARIPRDEAECAGLFRSLLADRRFLVVLDNARDTRQVRPLLPGTGSNAVLVTSRSRLADLGAATRIDLTVPSLTEALDMLASSAGPARVASEPDAAVALVAACGQLPLALRVAGSRVASRPDWTVRAAVDRLADQNHRLDRLRSGDISVESSFELSYQELGPRAARAFRMLAVAPGTSSTASMAAVLLGVDVDAAEDDLIELVDGNLLQLSEDSRFRYHDLLRLFAMRKADREESAPARSAAVQRILDWYLAHVAAAMRMIYPEMIRLPVSTAHDAAFVDADAALAWLDAELTGLVAAIEAAARGEHRSYAWRLADQLRGYFFVRRYTASWLATGRAALVAAEADDDVRAQAAVHQTIGQAYWSLGQHERALREYECAASLAEECGWWVGLAYLVHNVGLVQAELGRLGDAHANYRRVLEMSQGSDFDHVRAVTLNDMGSLCLERGQLKEAVDYFSEALDMSQRAARYESTMVNRNNLGMALRQLGRFTEARGHLDAVLVGARRSGSRHSEVSVLDEWSQLHVQLGEPTAAIEAAQRGLELSREVNDRRAEAALLSTLGFALLSAGGAAEAEQRFRESLDLASACSYPYFDAQARIGLARANLAAGQVADAVAAAETALVMAQRAGYSGLECEALLTHGQACLAVGRLDDAVRSCHAAMETNSCANSPLLAERAARLMQLVSVGGGGGAAGPDGESLLPRRAATSSASAGSVPPWHRPSQPSREPTGEA